MKASQPSSRDTDLSVIHINKNFIGDNGDTFLGFLLSLYHSFDVICLSETWPNQDERVDYNFLNYKNYYSVRLCRTGGGVMISVADHYDCLLISAVTVNLSYSESEAMRLTYHKKTNKASTVYRLANTNFHSSHSFVENDNPIRDYSTSDHIICGNFNLILLNVHDIQNNSSMFYNDMHTKNLLHTIPRSTRRALSLCALIRYF